jgi:hypothetical protein
MGRSAVANDPLDHELAATHYGGMEVPEDLKGARWLDIIFTWMNGCGSVDIESSTHWR